MLKIVPLLLFCTMAVSCSPTLHMNKTHRKLPQEYLGLKRADTLNIARLEWNEFFPDTLLHHYIRIALENNYSFQNAMERVKMAENNLKARRSAFFPSVEAGLGAGVERFGRYTQDGLGLDGLPDPYQDYQIGVSFQWEIDLWGKINQKKKAAMHRWMASTEAVRLAQSYIIQEMANHYFRLIGLDYFQEVIEEYIEDTERACALTAELKASGEETQLAVDQFNARLYRLKGILLQNRADILATERAMSLLMGVLPQEIRRISFDELQAIDFQTYIGMPGELLLHRPDILIAERELDAAECDAEAARRAFFPSLTLGGSGGFNAFDITRLFVSPASLVFNVVGGLTAPIFQARQIKTGWENARSQQMIALNNYFETVLSAYQEVVGVVTELELTQKHLQLKEAEMTSHQNSSDNATEMFQLQFASYLEVLSAEEKYFDCRTEYMELQMKYCRLMVDLYRSLGGGATAVDIPKRDSES